ncbi:hypothetical protein [Sphingobium sp. WCS2017Hpa-17]|uniref:hypothetical protein n=1 Tax=Sphingobium sp. WCS2017Hpa-17 TaxID=3073638 RepID=UPI002889F713|nr:hypothetical protein [Sphingobium sp. WCS2017Hpa-17]
MADGIASLNVRVRPPRWSGGLPMLVMCGPDGEALPGQVSCQVTTLADGTSRAVVAFDVDGTDVTLNQG